MESDLAAQIRNVVALFQQGERQAKEMLVAARAQGLSFGLHYNHIDDDIAQLIGRLHYMEVIAEHHRSAQRDDA